jgi:AcrR family transcriptional regulator
MKKSEMKREYILDKARGVFIARGYAKVTMKDIVDACGISRGGLYLYFGSTKELFLAVFQNETMKSQSEVEVAMWEKLPPRQILSDYLDQHKKEMLGEIPSLAKATYEFFLENEEEQVIHRWQFDGVAEMLREILEYGVATGDFQPMDTAAWGRHLAHFLNGMCLTVPVLNMPEQRVDEELNLLLSPIMA